MCNPVAKLDERSSVGIAHRVGLNDTTDKKSKTGLCTHQEPDSAAPEVCAISMG